MIQREEDIFLEKLHFYIDMPTLDDGLDLNVTMLEWILLSKTKNTLLWKANLCWND